MRVGPVKNSRTLNLGTFQFKPPQGEHLSKVDKNFCPVSVRFVEVPLYARIRIRANPYSGIFYAVLIRNIFHKIPLFSGKLL